MATMSQHRSAADRAAYVTLGMLGILGAIFFVLIACLLVANPAAARAQRVPTSNLPRGAHLTIVAQEPGSSVQGPMYTPSTNLVLPAHTRVTITITNLDEGNTPLSANSPFRVVTGTVGGVAYLDGIPYRVLDVSKVAHTFTIPLLGVNVPIPGDVPHGQHMITVSFSFMTGNAGTYLWRCMDPCGSGDSGWDGPMTMPGYMQGTLTLE